MMESMWQQSEGGTKPVEIHHRFAPFINNVVCKIVEYFGICLNISWYRIVFSKVWRMVTGQRSHHDDPLLVSLTQSINDMIASFDPTNPLHLLQVHFG